MMEENSPTMTLTQVWQMRSALYYTLQQVQTDHDTKSYKFNKITVRRVKDNVENLPFRAVLLID